MAYRILVEYANMVDEVRFDYEINPLNLTARDLVMAYDSLVLLPHDSNGQPEWHNIHLYLEPSDQGPIFMPLDNKVFNEFPEEGALYHFQIKTPCTRCRIISSIYSTNGVTERICYACNSEEYFDDAPYSESEEQIDSQETSPPHTPRNQGIEVSIPNAPRRVNIRSRENEFRNTRRVLDFCSA